MKTMSTTMAAVVSSLREELPTSAGQRELAVKIHDFVRDEIQFGFTRKHDMATAEYTLSRRIGHCTPKTELFVRLLKEAGFDDATVVAVPIPGHVLRGLGSNGSSPFPSRVHHTFAEVTVEKRKCRVDSYVVDAELFESSKSKLKGEGVDDRTGGGPNFAKYGIHPEGRSGWDGKSDSFCQYVESTHVPSMERRFASTQDILTDAKYYLHEDLLSILKTWGVGYLMGSWLESQNEPIGSLRLKGVN